MDIHLNLINESNDAANSDIVIFQKNAATGFGWQLVAWQVIQNLQHGDNHPFVYPAATTICTSDGFGNFTPQVSAESGQRFSLALTRSGNSLSLEAMPALAGEIQIDNRLPIGAINTCFYKGGKLAAMQANVAPQQKSVFELAPTLCFAAASHAQEGHVLNPASMTGAPAELSFEGIASADIVMSGGGTGQGATPYQFSLKNVVMA